MNKSIPLSVPNLSGHERDYVLRAIDTEWVSSAGPDISQFERMFVDRFLVKGACACQSGSAGLHLCMRHFGIGRNDIVLVPTLTFIATVTPVIYQSAVPVFFDCDKSMCISSSQMRTYLETECSFDGSIVREKTGGRQVKAIVPVHVFGDLCDMDEIMELAEEYKLVVIEDATESLGGTFPLGRYAGRASGTVGHAGVFSFNGNKIITTGGGGMIVSDDIEAVEHMRYLSQQAKDDMLYFVHNEIGYNYRMTNIQAALGIAQMEQLDQFIEVKRRNHALYKKELANCSFATVKDFYAKKTANYWFYSLVLNRPDRKLRDDLILYLGKNGVQARPIWKLNHQQLPLQQYPAMDTPTAQAFYDSVVNIPCSTNLSVEDVHSVCHLILGFAGGQSTSIANL